MHRNPMKNRCFAPLIFTPDYGRGACGICSGLFPKTMGTLLNMFINTPTVIFCDGFCLGKIMRKLLFILSLFVAGLAHARVLHVDDNVIKLSQTKTTNPALHVRIGDELWYGNMVRCTLPMNESTDKELKVRYNDKIYNVIEPFTDTTNYTYDENGRLIAANCDIYLESTGTQWIDTNYWPTAGTAAETEGKITRETEQSFGSVAGSYKTGSFIRSPQMYFGPLMYTRYYNQAIFYFNDYHFTFISISVDDRVNGYLSVNKENTSAVSIIKNLTTGAEKETIQSGYIDAETTLCLFGTCMFNGVTNKKYITEMLYGKVFFYKIWQDDVLVRHFVPVPCGLKIGNFVVPSNGMWDIVEQKFYGNMGTGDFIYGVDE